MGERLGQAPVADYRSMTHEQRLDALTGIGQQRAVLDAAQARLLAAVYADPLPNEDGSDAAGQEWAREEVALVLRLSSGTARSMILAAHDLVTRFPATLAMLETGQISAAMVRRLENREPRRRTQRRAAPSRRAGRAGARPARRRERRQPAPERERDRGRLHPARCR
jgi:hypothetical protein